MASQEPEAFFLKLEFPSDPELLCVVRGAVQQLAAVAGLSESESRSITLAVDEALANVMRHAYDNQRGLPIRVLCARHEDRLEFLVVDRGRSVDPSELRGRPLDDIRPGGLGTHFIREIMDEVEYVRTGDWNNLRLVKYLTAPKPHSRS